MSKLLIGVTSLALVLVITLDRRVNTTQSVLDGSFIQKIERVHPYVAPNGQVYVKASVDASRRANEHANRLHCQVAMSAMLSNPAECGL